MAKKRTPAQSGITHLLFRVRENINTLRDDCAEDVLERLDGDDTNKFEDIKQRIEACRAAVEHLHDILDWCEGVAAEEND